MVKTKVISATNKKDRVDKVGMDGIRIMITLVFVFLRNM